MALKCQPAIEAALGGRKLTDRETAAVARQTTALLKQIGTKTGPEAEAVLKEFQDRLLALKGIAKRNTALNYFATSSKKLLRQQTPAMMRNPAEGLKALFQTSLADFKNSKNALTTKVSKMIHGRAGALISELESVNLAKYAFGGADDMNIGKAMWHLKQEVVDEPAFNALGPNAVVVAKILNKHFEVMRQDLNRAGAWVGKLSDFIVSRGHDSYKIARAGGNGFGTDASKDAWVQHVYAGLDWTKSFDGEYAAANVHERTAVLQSLWTSFTAGQHLSYTDQPGVAGRGFQNLGAKASHQRELHFKTPEADITYQKTFGRGDSLAESAMHSMFHSGRDLAIMREWGPNARANIEKFVTEWKEELHAQGRPVDAAKLEAEYDKQKRNTWPVISNEIGHPGNKFAAQWNAAARTGILPAKLGNVVLSSIGDLALRSSLLNHYGVADSFFADIAHGITGQMAALGSGTTTAEKNFAAEAGILLESPHLPMSNSSMDEIGLGAVNRFNQMAMKYFGHSWWGNRVRVNTLTATGVRHAQMAGTEFANLPEGLQRGFRQYGIGEDEWNIIRRQTPHTLDNGHKVFSPSAVAEMDPKEFTSVATMRNPSEPHLKRMRDTVADNYRNLMGELADRTTSAPDLTMRAIMMQGTRPGTWTGEAMRHLMLLKGFTANIMRNHLGRELYGYNEDRLPFSQAMYRMLTLQDGGKAFAGTAKLVSAGVAFGYLSNSLADIFKGVTPDTDWETALPRAMVKQSFGIYTDFLLGNERDDASFADRVFNLAGPTVTTAGSVGDVVFQTLEAVHSERGMTAEKEDHIARRVFQIAYGSLPGSNLFYTRYAMDYLILHNISEMIDPGYTRRAQDAMLKRSGQQYFAPPNPQVNQ